jgi:hypothetical protein
VPGALTRRLRPPCPQLEGPDWDAAVARWAAAFGARHGVWGDATPVGPLALAAAEAAGADWDVRAELRERRESNSAVFEAARRDSCSELPRKSSEERAREDQRRAAAAAVADSD